MCAYGDFKVLGPFPVDDVTLAALEHALSARYRLDDDGNHQLVGADYDLSMLLDFLSGYDPEKVIKLEHDVTEYVGGQVYSLCDVVEALIAEVRRTRGHADV